MLWGRVAGNIAEALAEVEELNDLSRGQRKQELPERHTARQDAFSLELSWHVYASDF
jgi:hypothetical protein